jgi:hypothetical protein
LGANFARLMLFCDSEQSPTGVELSGESGGGNEISLLSPEFYCTSTGATIVRWLGCQSQKLHFLDSL